MKNQTQWGRKETVIWPPQVPIYSIGSLLLDSLICSMSKQVSLLQEPYNKWTAGSFSYQVNKMDLNGPPDETDMNEAANSTFYPTRASSQPRIHGDFITRLPNEILLIICGHILKTYTPAFVQCESEV